MLTVHDTSEWSERPVFVTVTSLGSSAEIVITTSSRPPRSCVGVDTRWTKSNAARMSFSLVRMKIDYTISDDDVAEMWQAE